MGDSTRSLAAPLILILNLGSINASSNALMAIDTTSTIDMLSKKRGESSSATTFHVTLSPDLDFLECVRSNLRVVETGRVSITELDMGMILSDGRIKAGYANLRLY